MSIKLALGTASLILVMLSAVACTSRMSMFSGFATSASTSTGTGGTDGTGLSNPTPVPTPAPTPVPISVSSSLPALPSTFAPTAQAATAVTKQITVFQASQPVVAGPPGSIINIGANFNAASAVSDSDTINIFLVDAKGKNTSASVQNNLNNYLTILPTTIWSGPISVTSSLTLPQVPDGTYYLMLSLNNASGPVQLTPGSGIVQDAAFRYYVGAVNIAASAPAPLVLPAVTLDLTGYHLTFDEEFSKLSISDATVNDGSTWYTHNEQCCMQTTDGSGTAMVGLSDPENPFSLIAGGGLDIRLQKVNNNWTSGVLTSVDNSGKGFSQTYGYFEMKANFPTGLDTWPAFWLLNTAAKSSNAPAGEIDIVEYIANPGFANYFATTLHDWQKGTSPGMSHNMVTLPTSGSHTYGMMWTAQTMTFYYDGTVTFQCATPSIMNQAYYPIINLGIGSGWPTDTTPAVNDMKIQYVRVYSK